MDNELYARVLSRLQGLCSRREYCSSEIHRKALTLAQDDEFVAAAVLDALKKDKFLDDFRYASAFARDKSSLSGWGAGKISFALKGKGIDSGTVELALKEIDGSAAGKKLDNVIAAKYRTLREDPQWKLKLIRFGLGRGYAYDEVKDSIGRISSGDGLS